MAASGIKLWLCRNGPALSQTCLPSESTAQHMPSLGCPRVALVGEVQCWMPLFYKQTNKQTKKPNIFLASLCWAYGPPLETFALHSLQGLWPWGLWEGFQAQTPLIAATGTRRLMRIICQPITTTGFLHYFIWLILMYLKWVTGKSEFSRLPFLMH